MKNKAVFICLAFLALSLVFLALLSIAAGNNGYKNLLLVTPADSGAQGFSPEKLEDVSGEGFLLTYEIRRPAVVRAINSNHTVTVVGTNHNYAGLMGYPVLDGGFFTKAAYDTGNRHAVLNETAAFKLFGSSRISGSVLRLNDEAWVISGVIQDNDAETANIYAPSSAIDGQAESLMALMDAAATRAYVENALKGIGIHSDKYDFINLSKSASAFGERFSAAWKSALLAAVLLLVYMLCKRIPRKLRFYRSQMSGLYFRELLARYYAGLSAALAELLLIAAGIVSALWLSAGILKTCLTWQEIIPVTGKLIAGDFGAKLIWLYSYQSIGTVLFAICIASVLLCFLLMIKRIK